MQFFLHEIVARVVAIYLFVDGSRALWIALAERKTWFLYYDVIDRLSLMDRFFRVPEWTVNRDSAPFRFWFLISGQVFTLIACLVMAIFGWWTPKM
jgi:hypothetical protein